MPSSLHARNTRIAISPRLAQRTFRIGTIGIAPILAKRRAGETPRPEKGLLGRVGAGHRLLGQGAPRPCPIPGPGAAAIGLGAAAARRSSPLRLGILMGTFLRGRMGVICNRGFQEIY